MTVASGETLRIPDALLIALFSLLLANFPISVMVSEFNLVNVVGLGGTLLVGGAATGWGVLLGLLAGYATRPLWPRRMAPHAPPMKRSWLEAFYQAGLVSLAVGSAWLTAEYAFGSGTSLVTPDPERYMLFSLVFVLAHTLLWWVGAMLSKAGTSEKVSGEWRSMALLEFMPLPFIWISLLGFQNFRWILLVAIGIMPLIIAILLYGMAEMRFSLEQRIQELSILNEVSDVLRSTLKLDELLQATYTQINRLLGVNNFYVALVDQATGRIYYPLAIKRGTRQTWAARLPEDRLTERVIRGMKPLRYQEGGDDPTPEIDLPHSKDSPTAWLGVPLNRNEQVIGCLCMYSYDIGADFTQPEVEMLQILSGQISVALDNALLYEESRRRTAQLETFNRISSMISASLDPEEVLSQVCQSVSRIGGGRRSAIYLLELGEGQVWLAASHGLSKDFLEANQTFSVAEEGRGACLHQGEPDLVEDIRSSAVNPAYQEALTRVSIQAVGDFPMLTPEGQLGFLAVYYDEPHHFLAEEVELLKTLASVAAIAVSNARQFVRTDQALENRVRQLAILEAVSRELAANLHSERLFELIMNYAREFTGSKWASIGLFHPGHKTLEIKASIGYLHEVESLPAGYGLAGRAVREQRIINVGDVQLEGDYIDRSGGEARAHLSVPLRYEGRVLGVLTLEKPEPFTYTENDEAFIGQLANQAAVALVNAELYNEIQARLREQSSLYLVSTRLAGDLELGSVLRTIFRAIQAALSNPVLGIYLWEEERRVYDLQPGLQDLTAARLVARESDSVQTRRESKSLLNSIPARELGSLFPRLLESVPVFFSQEQDIPDILRRGWHGWQVLLLPIVVHQQRLGVVLVYLEPRRPLLANELQLVSAISTQGGISVENAMLFADVSHGREQLEAVLNSAQEGVMMVEADGRLRLVNDSIRRMTGVVQDELLGKPFAALPSQMLERFGYGREAAFELVRSLERGMPLTDARLTYRLSTPIEELYVERTTLPVCGSGGRTNGLLIMLRDVSEEIQAAEARKLVTETLVHDMRSPLSAVVSALDVLQDGLQEDTNREILPQALAVARRGAGRVLSMVESLLDISRMQAGSIELNPKSINLQAMVDSVLVDFMPQAQDYGIVARNQIGPDIYAYADLGKVSRVLINLLDNGLKFTPPGGEVCFSAERWKDDRIAVHVSDTGPGIPQEYRVKIFDQFAQVPGTRSRRRGSGLGLTFCRLTVEAHGGKIWWILQPGGGSTFTFTLPVAEEL